MITRVLFAEKRRDDMGLIQWSEKYSVGNELIDEQHKKWIEIYNTAHEKMMSSDETLFRSIGVDALTEMKAYAEYHFSSEENFMESIGFDQLESHKRLHNVFRNRIEKIILDIHKGNHVLNSEIIKTVENWLVNHILTEDQKIKTLIK